MFDHVGGKFVGRQHHYAGLDALQDPPPVLRPRRVLENVLDHEISKAIPGQILELFHDTVHDVAHLLRGTLLNELLQDAAPVGLACHFGQSIVHCLNDEINVRRRHGVDAPLNHVVPVLVFHNPHNVPIQLTRQLDLLVQLDALQGLLEHPAAVHVLGEALDVAGKRSCQCSPLVGLAALQELLNHVISEHVHGKLGGVRQELLKCSVLLGYCARL
mmetsp:Transcript_8118/g.19340  ORF Transcript_8118/g.19340 Transcript_8118/m.19340 type:complete len:216 (-) Transcript_8118:834-1481(-)